MEKVENTSNKKASVEKNISLDQWKEYFEKLFEWNTDPDEQTVYNIFEEEPIADEIEDFIFNSDITEDEILSVV